MRLFVILALLLTPAAVFADAKDFECGEGQPVGAARGREILTRTQDTYATLRTLQAHFSQESYLSSLEISEISDGRMWFSKPGLMKWHYSPPNEQDFIVRDKTYWLYQVQDRQVVIDSFSEILITDLPIAFVLGLGNLARDFKLANACLNRDKDAYILELLPAKAKAKKDDQLKGFLLMVDKDTSLPRGSQVTDIAGNVTRMIFASLEKDKPIAPEVFALNFPEGIDINDRRGERRSKS